VMNEKTLLTSGARREDRAPARQCDREAVLTTGAC
jgi:hypothetical protein